MGSWSRGGVTVLSVGCHPNLPPQFGPGSWGSGLCCRHMRLARRGGGWLRVPVLGGRGEAPAQTGAKALGPPCHTGCWWSLLRVQDRGSGSVRTFIGHTAGLGLGWGLSSQVVGRLAALGESSAQGKLRVLRGARAGT